MDPKTSSGNKTDEPQSSNAKLGSSQQKGTMKLAPDNFPGKSVLVKKNEKYEKWDLYLGDINDEKALTIRVEGDFIHNADPDMQDIVLWCNFGERKAWF